MSLFAGLEKFLRRFSVFAEEPRKSIITAIEPCSPVFKAAQPRPSNSQSRRAKHSVEFKSLIVVHNVFLLLVICCCNKASNRIVPKTKGISVFWIPLSPEVSRLSPYTHTHINICKLQEPSVYSLYTGAYTPSLVENLMSRGRREKVNSGLSVADCVHTAIFQNIREKTRTVQCKPNPGRSPHMDLRSASTTKRTNR